LEKQPDTGSKSKESSQGEWRDKKKKFQVRGGESRIQKKKELKNKLVGTKKRQKPAAKKKTWSAPKPKIAVRTKKGQVTNRKE